jgi:uncharacterized protein YceK
MRGFVVVLVALALGGCATIVRGTTEDVAIQTEPTGAEAKTSNGFGCPETPCVLNVPRKDPFILTVAKAGYHSEQVTVGTAIQGGGTAGLVGNVVGGGIVGVVVDASSGAANDHVPNPVIVKLKPIAPVSPLLEQRRKRTREAPATVS